MLRRRFVPSVPFGLSWWLERIEGAVLVEITCRFDPHRPYQTFFIP